MKRLSAAVVFLIAGLACAKEPSKPFDYPPTPKSGQSDDYHGTKVDDPFLVKTLGMKVPF